MSEPTPQTGDPVVDEVLDAFRATEQQPLAERAEAATQAQRRLQEHLAESAPGSGPAAAQRVAGDTQPS